MPPNVQVGAILIEDWPLATQCLGVESEPYSGNWSLVKVLDGFALDRKIHAAGWNFFFMATQVKAMFFGALGAEKIQNALKRILRKVKQQHFNGLEVTEKLPSVFWVCPIASFRHTLGTSSRAATWITLKHGEPPGETQNGPEVERRQAVGFPSFSVVDRIRMKRSSTSMATKFTPLHDRILVRRVEEAGTTRGGIIIPDSAKDKPQEGEVLSVGKGKTNDEGKLFPLAVKEGDRILFGKYCGTEIKIDGEDFLIMKEEEVLGIVSGAAKKETVGAKR